MIVALTGFMGSGKSTAGRALAHKTGFSFIDLDEYIEISAGYPIPVLFSREGERGFRKKESECLREILDAHKDRNLVLALGGGTILEDTNVVLMEQAGCRTVYLDVPVRELESRLEGNYGNRPLLESRTVSELLAQRREKYERVSQLRIHSAGMSVRETADEILKELKQITNLI